MIWGTVHEHIAADVFYVCGVYSKQCIFLYLPQAIE